MRCGAPAAWAPNEFREIKTSAPRAASPVRNSRRPKSPVARLASFIVTSVCVWLVSVRRTPLYTPCNRSDKDEIRGKPKSGGLFYRVRQNRKDGGLVGVRREVL